MSGPQISALIDKTDTSEIVRDEIAAILAVESTAQQALAITALKDPKLWKLRVFVEATNPWADWIDAPAQTDGTPIINVSVDNLSYNGQASNVVERQDTTGTYNIDCYGYGLSENVPAGGHIAGDQRAAIECQRAVRLVRNIVMAAAYTYLGLRGTVGRRFIQSVQFFQPQLEGRSVPHVVAARVALAVRFNELSPQVPSVPLELIATTVKQIDTGEVLVNASYPY